MNANLDLKKINQDTSNLVKIPNLTQLPNIPVINLDRNI